MKRDVEYLPLSYLSQLGYCPRRVGLLLNERIWLESSDTAKGRKEHESVHTQRIERRGQELKLFEYPVVSNNLGVSGKCDLIEARGDPSGCQIPAVDFPVLLYPVEYKHGKLREEKEYKIQLCAQAMCLEEMFSTEIPAGAVFYGETRRRETVVFTEELRQEVRSCFSEMHEYYRRGYTPKVKRRKACSSCSLKEICLPGLSKTESVKTYLSHILEEDQE